jgi:hypothetical protein
VTGADYAAPHGGDRDPGRARPGRDAEAPSLPGELERVAALFDWAAAVRATSQRLREESRGLRTRAAARHSEPG